ncbi:hypothetical protein RchiOBHm_Chr1g0369071 [Rosa chinensis]|uniref:ZCF37 n=1 Tax=Rosa chinensis TaxID=74649 RepID=A0A2P6SKX2_ROSCH|nr:uncharacterized protein LOC112170922 [Rosa chinensis]XP_040368743.1 uncharacterized protein LOC112170922 [Rosa chinensis]PRQ59334.1 hypothetical protein RchiOBHm_Chr1g0369071 [Rosa chinensis]
MFSPFSCGNFSQVDDDEPVTASPYSTTKKSRSRRSSSLLHRSNSRDNKNPYANVGLEKFSAVMAELEEKRRQIYAQTGSQDETLVHFVYKKPDDSVPVPIVVILKDKKDDKTKSGVSSPDRDEKHVVSTPRTTEALGNKFKTIEEIKKPGMVSDKLTKKRVYKKCSDMWMMPSFYLPVAVIFILVLLAVFGRSIAILCTSIGWYAVPTLKEYQSPNTSTRSRATTKKDEVRRLSDKKMVADHGLLSSPKT